MQPPGLFWPAEVPWPQQLSDWMESVVWQTPVSIFHCSFLVLSFRPQKGTDTRSETAGICPIKSVCGRTVLLPEKPWGQIGTLVAGDHSQKIPSISCTSRTSTLALIE